MESWAVIAVAFIAGASCPQVGPMARVRWMALTTRNLAAGTQGAWGGSSKPGGGAGAPGSVAANRADLDTALSYESTADEVTFVLGPALVGVLASLVAPWLPLTLAVVLTITLVPLFAVHPTHRAVVPEPRRTRQGKTVPGAGSWLLVMLPVLAMVCMGTFFGATQTALAAFSGIFATPEVAGLLYAVMGLTSAVAALSVAFWPQRFGRAGRWLASSAAMAQPSWCQWLRRWPCWSLGPPRPGYCVTVAEQAPERRRLAQNADDRVREE